MKQQKKGRRPLAIEAFHGRKLKNIRERLGLSLGQVQKMTGIATSSLWDYEHGKIVPQLHQFKTMCEAYRLDPTEVCELMRLKIYEDFLLQEFRRGCQKAGKSPGRVICELMAGYALDMSKRPFK